MKIFWLSRHALSPAQVAAIRSLHGESTEIIHDPVVFADVDGLRNYIRNHRDGFVYAVAGSIHYIVAAFDQSCGFGVFENHPAKRQDGTFGLAAVYWVNYPDVSELARVWVNPDPASDQGETMVPVSRR